MSSVAVIGTGYVGLTTAVCLAEIGHTVTGVDIDEAKIAQLRSGAPTIYEPGLEELLASTLKAGRLTFTSDYQEAIPSADFVFIAVGTPPGRRGEADLHFVKQAAKAVALAMKKTVTIVNKSTVPIGTGNIVARIVGENLDDEIPFYVVSNPEFLREGSAIHDFMHPDRLVFGSNDEPAAPLSFAALDPSPVPAPTRWSPGPATSSTASWSPRCATPATSPSSTEPCCNWRRRTACRSDGSVSRHRSRMRRASCAPRRSPSPASASKP